MYRYKTIRSPPITDNAKFALKDESIVLGIIVTGYTDVFDIHQQNLKL